MLQGWRPDSRVRATRNAYPRYFSDVDVQDVQIGSLLPAPGYRFLRRGQENDELG